MKRYKFIDYWIQVILIAGSIVSCMLFDWSAVFISYFLVGGWQLSSCLIHALFARHFYPEAGRKHYVNTLGWLALCAILTIPIWPIFWFGMLIYSIFLAGWYLHICREENIILEHKRLVHLK